MSFIAPTLYCAFYPYLYLREKRFEVSVS